MSTETTARPKFTLDEWQVEMAKRGKMDCKFVCPQCGHEASPNDWKAAGGDPQRAPQECIGRLSGAVGSLGTEGQPCDWAAFGLLGTLNGGTKLVLPDRETWVFDFAAVSS